MSIMVGAIVRDNTVERTIVIREKQICELSEALGCEIVDARPYGLTAGDLRTARGWTRNEGGAQIVLPLLDEEQSDSYTLAERRADAAEARAEEAEAQLEAAADAGAAEMMEIISGEVTE